MHPEVTVHPLVRRAGHRLRHHALEVWTSRGGGFYGFAAMVTFLWLEGVNVVGDIASLGSLEPNLGAVIGWFVQNTVQGLLTALWAAIWPAAWISHLGVGVTSGLLFAGSYVAYRAVRPSVTRLLSEPED